MLKFVPSMISIYILLILLNFFPCFMHSFLAIVCKCIIWQSGWKKVYSSSNDKSEQRHLSAGSGNFPQNGHCTWKTKTSNTACFGPVPVLKKNLHFPNAEFTWMLHMMMASSIICFDQYHPPITDNMASFYVLLQRYTSIHAVLYRGL